MALLTIAKQTKIETFDKRSIRLIRPCPSTKTNCQPTVCDNGKNEIKTLIISRGSRPQSPREGKRFNCSQPTCSSWKIKQLSIVFEVGEGGEKARKTQTKPRTGLEGAVQHTWSDLDFTRESVRLQRRREV